ncbi:uncharacterized protein LOC108736916 [Agrilus planipennis]|uniref:Uncharacterized protein LOC108736916 n=1 Tax=Agrilus planipennis TaxID=224129 RepID=A0A1W4WM92_AGRPL|nr:uncharacterized protein LOC108736916 [Agrilus planipennis]
MFLKCHKKSIKLDYHHRYSFSAIYKLNWSMGSTVTNSKMSILQFILVVLCMTYGIYCQQDDQKNIFQIKETGGSLFKDTEQAIKITNDLTRTKRYAGPYKKGGGGSCCYGGRTYGGGGGKKKSGYGYGYGYGKKKNHG